jgi:hypothetical protein
MIEVAHQRVDQGRRNSHGHLFLTPHGQSLRLSIEVCLQIMMRLLLRLEVAVPYQGRCVLRLGCLFDVPLISIIRFPHHLSTTRNPTGPREQLPVTQTFCPRRRAFLAARQRPVAPPSSLAAVVAGFGGKVECGDAHWMCAMRDVSHFDQKRRKDVLRNRLTDAQVYVGCITNGLRDAEVWGCYPQLMPPLQLFAAAMAGDVGQKRSRRILSKNVGKLTQSRGYSTAIDRGGWQTTTLGPSRLSIRRSRYCSLSSITAGFKRIAQKVCSARP